MRNAVNDGFMVWAGDLESFQTYIQMKTFMSDPDLFSKVQAFRFDDDDEDTGKEASVEDEIGFRLVEVRDGLGILNVSGPLINGYSVWNSFFGVVSYQEIRSAISILRNDPSVKKVMVNMDSPGGMVSGLDEASKDLSALSSEKPTYAYTGSRALSGGYWLSASAAKIYSAPMAQVGSIGVIMVHTSYVKALEKNGIDATIFRAGSKKALGHPYEQLSKTAKAEIQKDIDKVYGFFTGHVADHRGLNLSRRADWADGRVFYSGDAKAAGLIDGVAYMDVVINAMVKGIQSGNRVSCDDGNDKDVETMAKKLVGNETELAKLENGLPVETTDAKDETADQEVSDPKTDAGTEGEAETQVADKEQPEGSEVSDPQEAETNAKDGGGPEGTKNELFAETQQKLIEVSGELAVANAKLTEVEGKLSEANANNAELVKIAVAACNKQEIALGKSPSALDGLPAATVVEKYNTVNAQFNDTFGVGAKAKAVKDADDVTTAVDRPNIYPIEG